MTTSSPRRASGLLPLAAALVLPLALAACGGQEEETEFATDTVDQSGGELIVSEQDPNAVPVDTPDTPMTPVPEGAGTPTPAAKGTPVAEPAAGAADSAATSSAAGQ